MICLLLFFSLVLQVYWLVEFGPLKPNNIEYYAQDKDSNTLVYNQPQEGKPDMTGYIIFDLIYWQYISNRREK